MDTKLYKEYTKLQKNIKALEEVRDAVRDEILAGMTKAGIDTDKNQYGTFAVTERKIYTYSPAVAKAAEKVKIMQITEQEKGIAKARVTRYLTVRI